VPTGAEYQERRQARAAAAADAATRAITEITKVIGKFRAEHDWQPGQAWNPYAGVYEQPQVVTRPVTSAVKGSKLAACKNHDDHPRCRFTAGQLGCVNDPCGNPHHRRAGRRG
jgi:hypothetical protein